MASISATSLMPLIREFAQDGTASRASDGQLLEWFLTLRQEAAFRALVDRHGPMVMGVCRRILRDAHDAEDAFQATFLVLARKAASVAPRELVANWLYGVAYRTAHKARVTRARAHAAKRRASDRVATMTAQATTQDELWHDLQPILDEELERLPAAYRAAVILCDLEGKPRKEAARQLGWPEGTLSGRLARARKRLAERLSRRGVTLSVAAMSAVATNSVTSAAVPAALRQAVVQAAVLSVTGAAISAGVVSAPVLALTEGVMKTMLIAKLRISALLLAAVGLTTVGTGLVARQVFAAGTPQPPAASGENVKSSEPQANRTDAEIHVIGIYSAKDKLAKPGRVNVEVRATAKPVVLVLTSYYSVGWHVQPAEGARIARVIVSGYNSQEVRGVPAGVPVVNRSYYPDDGSRRQGGWFWSHQWNSPQWREMVRRLNDATGFPVATFQSASEGESFIIDGTRGRSAGQKELPARTTVKEPTPQELRAASADAEVHVVGMYTPGGDTPGKPVDVEVRAMAKPVVLVLTSYMDAVWNLRCANGVSLRAVVAAGYYPQEVDGVPAGVPVHHYCPDAASHYFDPRPTDRTKRSFYAYQPDTLEYRRMVERLNDASGRLVSSFQGVYAGTSFVVDGTRGRDHGQTQRKPRAAHPKPVKPEDLRAAAAGADLHLVSIYATGTGNGTPVDVEVRATNKPVVLALASYMSALWKLKVADGVRLKAVIVGGYFEQEFEGIPADVPVVYQAYFPANERRYFYAHKSDTPEYQNTLNRLAEMTGLRPITAQVENGGTFFVVDGARGRNLAQMPGSDKPQPKPQVDALADVADIPAQDRSAGGDAKKRYFLVGPKKDAKPPEEGYGLVVVLPGGDGSADFNPFVRRIVKHALPGRFVVAQPVAPKWTLDQQIVWPTKSNPVPGMKFATEEFVEAVIGDVAKRQSLDRTRIFTLSWSSSGPAAYATSLQDGRLITGSFVAMSVFNPKFLPPLAAAKGHAYYLYHSPQDRMCPYRMAEQARDALTGNGAKVHLETYAGGHGWRGDVYDNIRAGVEWLVANREKASNP